MKYAYEDLSPEQFETLVVFLCQQLLGISVQKFSTGPDGGRDAKFVGTAELHPSKAAPWQGTVIVQAKHTNGLNRRFSDSDFFSASSVECVVGQEIPRIKRLRSESALDHYMLFSNRRLSGIAEDEIRGHLAKECGLAVGSLYLCGVEQLEVLLKTFPRVAVLADIDPIDSPLIVSPDELAELVEAFARHQAAITSLAENPPAPRVSYADKNAINNMTEDYAKQQRRNYLKDTAQIQSFLAAPENRRLQQLYQAVVDEFQLKITAKRKDHQSFDDVMEYLADLLFGRDPLLRANKRLTRAMLFTCIGTATSEQRRTMLRPTKHSHPDRTVVGIALVLLGRLRARRVEEYHALKMHLNKSIPGGDVLFVPALSFLYLLGLVEYRPKNDTIEYMGPAQ